MKLFVQRKIEKVENDIDKVEDEFPTALMDRTKKETRDAMMMQTIGLMIRYLVWKVLSRGN